MTEMPKHNTRNDERPRHLLAASPKIGSLSRRLVRGGSNVGAGGLAPPTPKNLIGVPTSTPKKFLFVDEEGEEERKKEGEEKEKRKKKSLPLISHSGSVTASSRQEMIKKTTGIGME